ncbi:MAG: DAK2 domain-containing protein [Lachnospiraceae bacterium]|nr:DAK2 domain-containing protein [Lachnospiraceae bacterium]
MGLQTVDAALFKKIFLASAQNIESQKEIINELNVFPVPDGDTGSNMTMTIMSAARDVAALENPSMAKLAKTIASGSLRGARGNSGVILSQLLRGFCKVIGDYDEIDVDVAANAFSKAVETAYKAVMKPKEGTILTVAKGGAQKAAELVGETEDMISFIEKVIEYMEEVLEYTPELLPVLKEAGVVDSGGRGLLEVMKGGFEALCGKEVEFKGEASSAKTASAPRSGAVDTSNISTSDIKYGYCTEFIILLEKKFTQKDEIDFKAFLTSIGDSIVCVADDEMVKVHVHTNHPGQAFEKGLTFGQLTSMKVDNMRIEHDEKLFKEQEKAADAPKTAAPEHKEPSKEYGFIAVAAGKGLAEIFDELGVDHVIEGGQTMNPSTEDMLNAIDAVDAKNIFIFPNNKNIILAAQQARDLTEDKNIIVIPSKTIPQGIAGIIGFVADKSADINEKLMTEACKNVKSGSVTYAVRDTKIDGKEIKMGDYMGLDDKTITSVSNDRQEAVISLIDGMVDEDSEVVCLYFGEDTTEEEAQSIANAIEEKYDYLEVEVHNGGQPVYYYILSVE